MGQPSFDQSRPRPAQPEVHATDDEGRAAKTFDRALRDYLKNSSIEEAVRSSRFQAQRRQFERAPANMSVVYSIEGAVQWQRASAIDLSGGGLRIWSVDQHAPGVQLAVRFRLPKIRRVVQARGRIVMSFFDGKTHDYSHGVAFAHIAQSDQEAIVEFVKDRQRTGNQSDAQRAS